MNSKNMSNRNTHKPYGIYEAFIKRPLDLILSSAAFIVLSPVLAATAIVVRTQIGSPVLFSQDRPGRNGKVFKLYKFRSMTDARDENGNPLPDDQRITSFGRKLRATSLDELPELLNIINGNMAIVGPRPLLVEYLPYYTEEEMRRHDVRPGLTGLAQIRGRNDTTWEAKFAADLEYVDKITFLGDVKIIIETVGKVFKKSGVLVGSQIKAGRLDDYRRDK